MAFIFSMASIVGDLRRQGHGEDMVNRVIAGFGELSRQGLVMFSRSRSCIGITEQGMQRLRARAAARVAAGQG